MKRSKRLFALILSVLTLTALLSPLGTSAASDPDVSISVNFTNPLPLNRDGEQFDKESSERISAILQGAYNAYIMDHPLSSMWLDITSSNVIVRWSTAAYNDQYNATGLGIRASLYRLDEYTNPKQMYNIVTEFVNKCPVKGDTVYEKVKFIHDYICQRVTYKNGKHSHSAYGSLIEKQAVCEGYAEAFALLCQKNGIDCILITGEADNGREKEYHMWNYVRMDDGKWYAVDVTWDDAGNKIRYTNFLVGSNTIADNNKKFSVSHTAALDVSYDGKFMFNLPKLSENAYSVNNPSLSVKGASYSVKNKTFFGNQLDDYQKVFYNALVKSPLPGGTNLHVVVDTSDFASSGSSSSDTTSPITTDKQTTAPNTTKPLQTTPSTTTAPKDTTPTTTKPSTTAPKETNPPTTKPTTTAPKETNSPTTEPSTTTPKETEPTTTAGGSTTSTITTDPVETSGTSNAGEWQPLDTDPVAETSAKADTSGGTDIGSDTKDENTTRIPISGHDTDPIPDSSKDSGSSDKDGNGSTTGDGKSTTVIIAAAAIAVVAIIAVIIFKTKK